MRRYGDKIQFIGMPGRDDVAAMRGFVDQYGLQDMPQAVSEDGSLWGRFGVPGQPAWVFVTPSGKYQVVLGSMELGALEDTLDQLSSA